MKRGLILLSLLVLAAMLLAVLVGETPLRPSDYLTAFSNPGSAPGEILWTIRAPRAVMAALVGAALGLAGAALQGLLRNPLADPGVLGVSASAGLGAGVAIALGLAAIPGAIEAAALVGALVAGALVVALEWGAALWGALALADLKTVSPPGRQALLRRIKASDAMRFTLRLEAAWVVRAHPRDAGRQ